MHDHTNYEVVVIGVGPAGVGAAIAAARTGARTALIEPSSFLGGAGTGSLVGPWMTNYYQDKQVIRGVFQDVVDELVQYEGSTGTLLQIRQTWYNTRDRWAHYSVRRGDLKIRRRTACPNRYLHCSK